jgi:hypothetical protein
VATPGSSYTACVRDVQSGVSQIGAALFWVTTERLAMAPFTTPLYIDNLLLWIKAPEIDDSAWTQMTTISKPFEGEVSVAGTISFEQSSTRPG